MTAAVLSENIENQNLLNARAACVFLKIDQSEYQRWVREGRIHYHQKRPIKQGKKTIFSYFHTQDQLKGYSQDMIEVWRQEDQLMDQQKSKKPMVVTPEIKNKLNETAKAWNTLYPMFWSKCWWALVPMSVEWEGETFEGELHYKISILSDINLDLVQSYEEILDGYCRNNQLVIESWVLRAKEEFEQSLSKLPEGLLNYEKMKIQDHIQDMMLVGSLGSLQNQHSVFLRNFINNYLEVRQQKHVQNALGLDDYASSFYVARRMKRHFHICLGPTNSGKTYEAIQALAKAESGVYLAPLRLLAMEIQESMMEKGVACSLHTGEEHWDIPDARHTSSTIEMVSVERYYDVAVIDEVQMLMDEHRGWAWTQAVLGVAASTVYVAGSPIIQDQLMRLIELAGDSYTVHDFERKCPLKVCPTPLGFQDLKEGDALVVFSRKKVLDYAEQLRRKGWSVATIYGALTPEVRRREARRFANGEAQIVVSTDAIGMGLNLPIHRVVFGQGEKFNGSEMVPLTTEEVRQIAGRAGRFGLHDVGWAGALVETNMADTLEVILGQPYYKSQVPLQIAPHWGHIHVMAEILKQQLPGVLEFFQNDLEIDHDLFKTANLEIMLELSRHVYTLAGDHLSMREQFTYTCSPCGQSEDEVEYFRSCLIQHIRDKKVDLFALPFWIESPSIKFLESAELLSKQLSLYAYWSYKFPEVYEDGDKVLQYREKITWFIDQVLLHFKQARLIQQ